LKQLFKIHSRKGGKGRVLYSAVKATFEKGTDFEFQRELENSRLYIAVAKQNSRKESNYNLKGDVTEKCRKSF
jgi:hypothetical protein